MTVLDTFWLLFKTDAPNAQQQTAALDKQLDELEKKGKKRSDEESKRYQELKKQRKELTDQLKDQERAADNLNDAFTNMIASAVGAAGAWTSFGALKSGLIDANRLNASLTVLASTYHLNAGELKAYGAALEQAGGNAQDLYTFVAGQAAYATANRLPLPPLGEYLKRLREQAHGPLGLTGLQSLPGGSAIPLVPLLQKSPADYDALVAKGHDLAKLGSQQETAALENQEAARGTKQAFDSLATAINTSLNGPLKSFNSILQSIADWLQAHPNFAVAASVPYALGSGLKDAGLAYLGFKGLKWFGGIFRSGAGKAATEAVAAGATVATAEAATGIGIVPAIITGVGLAVAGALGYWWASRGTNTPPAASGSVPTGSTRQRITDFWIAQGYSPGAAAGWAANAQAESGFKPLAVNGSHVGLYQWSATRRAKILAGTGIDVGTASLDEQLRAAAWEAKAYGLGPGNLPDRSGAAAALISNQFEVPALTPGGLAAEAAHRARIAEGYGSIPTSAGGNFGDGGRTINIKIDDVTIETQATDTTGIAREVGQELKNQIRTAMSNFDDGVLY